MPNVLLIIIIIILFKLRVGHLQTKGYEEMKFYINQLIIFYILINNQETEYFIDNSY